MSKLFKYYIFLFLSFTIFFSKSLLLTQEIFEIESVKKDLLNTWNKKFYLKIKLGDINLDKKNIKPILTRKNNINYIYYFFLVTPPLPERINEKHNVKFSKKRSIGVWIEYTFKSNTKNYNTEIYFIPKNLLPGIKN